MSKLSATVDLATARGRFEFDASVTAPDLIKEYVDDLGFTADVVTAAADRERLPDVSSQILILYAFGPSGLKNYGSATLRCKI